MESHKTLSSKDIAALWTFEQPTAVTVPLLPDLISAGFPSSAENYIEKSLDLNEFLIKHPAATFFVRVIGDSMIKAGIFSQDILIVDRALAVAPNKIVVARINNELTVKRIAFEQGKTLLMPDNDSYKALEITQEMDFEIWGVVTCVIHHV